MEESIKNKFIPFKEREGIWNDIEPIPQFSNEVEILKIDYPEDLRQINDYFRAILQKNEISLRAYNLTTELIEASPTNYMAWYHRRLCLDNIKELNLKDEMIWLNSITIENQKNYQIWHHRKVILEKLNDDTYEKKVLNEVFDDEPKNFHAWCHRVWVVRRFNSYEGELEYIEKMLNEDIRNNSVWNYRFFIITNDNKTPLDEDIVTAEINYALEKIKLVPNNESPYSYIRGIVEPINKINSYPQIKSTLESIVSDYPECYHSYSLLLDCAEQNKDNVSVTNLINKLLETDNIRKKYWSWRLNNYKVANNIFS